jgi:hypothetical protein
LILQKKQYNMKKKKKATAKQIAWRKEFGKKYGGKKK